MSKAVGNWSKRADPYHDLPVEEAARRAQKLIDTGYIVFFKFTCEKCGARLTFDRPNTIYEKGLCDQCGHITPIKKVGYTLMIVM